MNGTAVYFVGNLTDDPELKFTPSGAAVCNIRVAVTDRVQRDGSWTDGETAYWRVEVWRDYAEHVAETLAKGQQVIVIGKIKARSWETPEGQKRTAYDVVADEVGPGLRWATAKVEKASGSSSSSGQQSGEARPSKGGNFGDDAPF